MDPLKKENIAKEIWNLELKCQNGENISESFVGIDAIANKLTLNELFEVAEYIEDNLSC